MSATGLGPEREFPLSRKLLQTILNNPEFANRIEALLDPSVDVGKKITEQFVDSDAFADKVKELAQKKPAEGLIDVIKKVWGMFGDSGKEKAYTAILYLLITSVPPAAILTATSKPSPRANDTTAQLVNAQKKIESDLNRLADRSAAQDGELGRLTDLTHQLESQEAQLATTTQLAGEAEQHLLSMASDWRAATRGVSDAAGRFEQASMGCSKSGTEAIAASNNAATAVGSLIGVIDKNTQLFLNGKNALVAECKGAKGTIDGQMANFEKLVGLPGPVLYLVLPPNGSGDVLIPHWDDEGGVLTRVLTRISVQRLEDPLKVTVTGVGSEARNLDLRSGEELDAGNMALSIVRFQHTGLFWKSAVVLKVTPRTPFVEEKSPVATLGKQ